MIIINYDICLQNIFRQKIFWLKFVRASVGRVGECERGREEWGDRLGPAGATNNTNQSWKIPRTEQSAVPAHRPAMLRITILLLSLLLPILAQRSRHFEEEDEYGGNSLRPNSDVGDFPFQRGERPIFNFDQGDEVRRIKNIFYI